MTAYSFPVNQLLTQGKPASAIGKWPNYLQFDLGPGNVPELLRMMRDPELNNGLGTGPEIWAPIHAWRALGQLRAEAVVGALLEALRDPKNKDHDWLLEEAPVVFGMIGPIAIPDLEAFLFDDTQNVYMRDCAGRGLKNIVRHYPETRQLCLDVLGRLLDAAEPVNGELNGFVVSLLIDLDAKELAPLVERAFAANRVDESIAGDWEWTRWKLGLGPMPKQQTDLASPFPFPPPTRPDRSAAVREKAKARRKQAKASHKQNRKSR